MVGRTKTKWKQTPTDPWLSSGAWKTVSGRLRAEWLMIAKSGGVITCARCHKPIDLSLRYPHAGSLVVGHVVGRAEAKRRGWTMAMAHDRSNLQPEHKRCSQSAGAIDGNRSPKRKQGKGSATYPPVITQRPEVKIYDRRPWSRQEEDIRRWYSEE
jgi:hypothetical protein